MLRAGWVGLGAGTFSSSARFREAIRDEAEGLPHGGQSEPRVVDELEGLVSSCGARAEGRLYEIPMFAAEILENQDRALELITEAIHQAADWGARLVGLGSMTGVVGTQGTYVAQHSPIPVTTGNHLTVHAAVENLLQACLETGIDPSRETAAVIGIPGSIATAAARVLGPMVESLVLVARRPSNRATKIAEALGAPLVFDVPAALGRARLVISATSSGDCIDPAWLRPGSLVVDVGIPTDVRGTQCQRDDVLILSGGLARVPQTMPLDSIYLRFHQGVVPGCLAETTVLALEERAECFSLGRALDLDRVEQIGGLAKSHGFRFDSLLSFGLPLEGSVLMRFRKVLRAREVRSAVALRTRGLARVWPSILPMLRGPRRSRRSHLNPVLAALAGPGGVTKTFIGGSGCELWDGEGQRYLDCVAGFGALNLGHNHPAVVEAVREAMDRCAPGFSPAAINPWAAALGERLATVAPGPLEMAFFTNSGTEAVEAALKLARAATERSALLFCRRSFHGKTLGALSVTGNARYRRPFGPLVPQCRSVAYGDLEALERALAGRQFAALIVEPIQAEGGIRLPPQGYLREAQRLCRRAGALLIVDEVQTGLGRTGAMFAVEHEGVEPDVLTLAKSLGGGVMPLGAMLARRDLWMKAYGDLHRFALHTSTFGGGSLACAAGLAALGVMEEENLVPRAARAGRRLLEGLEHLCGACDLFVEARGKGLLLGLEFKPAADRLLALWKAVGPSKLRPTLFRILDAILRTGPSTYVMQSLLEEHHIYTQVARSQPLVLRIEPPLTISDEQIERLLAALGECCRTLDQSYKSFTGITAKSALGQHGAGSGMPLAPTTGQKELLPEIPLPGAIHECGL